MKKFDDKLPARDFDNFQVQKISSSTVTLLSYVVCNHFVILNHLSCFMQFVNLTDIMSKKISTSAKEAAFALAALMEIPFQYKAALELGLLG
jgi:E3 ubiquitin-protein ligase RGLG